MNTTNSHLSRREFAQLNFFTALLLMLGVVKADEWKEKDNYGFKLDRTRIQDGQGKIERALADTWAKWNRRSPGLNYGEGILQDLMLGCYRYEHPTDFDPWLSDRERKIVAMVIQWLGTNIGRSFLCEASEAMGVKQYPFSEAIRKLNDDEEKEWLYKELGEARKRIAELERNRLA